MIFAATLAQEFFGSDLDLPKQKGVPVCGQKPLRRQKGYEKLFDEGLAGDVKGPVLAAEWRYAPRSSSR